MDKNSVFGLILIFLIVILFTVFNSSDPKNAVPGKAISKNDSIIENIDAVQTDVKPSVVGAQDDIILEKEISKEQGLFNYATADSQQFITVENELLKLVLSNKGGRIYSVELKGYQTFDSLPLVLFDGDENIFNYKFPFKNSFISTQYLYFEIVGESFELKGDNTQSISFRMYAADDAYLEQVYTLSGKSYLIDYQLNFVNLYKYIPDNTNYLNLSWQINVPKQEKSMDLERMATTVYYRYLNDEEVDWLSETSDESEKIATPLHWLSFKQQFFNSTLIANEGIEEGDIATLTKENSDYVKTLVAELILPYDSRRNTNQEMQFYFGPNRYSDLKRMDIGLEKVIPLGWGIFGWVNKYCIIPVFNFLHTYVANFGIIILILTILIKLVLTPLTYKSHLSMVKMKVLKPELDELKKKTGSDQQKFSQEQLKLYRSAGVNPLGGCLPMLLQMPILIAMYRFFPSSIELRQESFLWATDLSTYDSIYDFPNGFSIPFYGDHISLFTLLMTVSTIIYTKANSQMQMPGGGAPGQMNMMKYMPYMMSIMFLGIFNNFSSALTYYYFLTNIFSFGQQYILKKFFIDEDKLLRDIQEKKKKPSKKSGFQKRLEEMARKKGYKS